MFSCTNIQYSTHNNKICKLNKFEYLKEALQGIFNFKNEIKFEQVLRKKQFKLLNWNFRSKSQTM